MAKFHVTGEQHFGITGQVLEIQRQIRQKGGSPIDPELVTHALQDIIEGGFIGRKNPTLRLLSRHQSIVIPPCDGTETLENAAKAFEDGLCGDLKKHHINSPSKPTRKTNIRIHELVREATFAQMFSSFDTDLEELCLTLSQIKSFCEIHPDWLDERGWTFFLFKNEDLFFVALIRTYPTGLNLSIRQLDDSATWSDEYHHRIVTPQLNA